jgi:hypothetical protein
VAIITADVSPIFRHAFRSRAAVQAIASLSCLFTFGHGNLSTGCLTGVRLESL